MSKRSIYKYKGTFYGALIRFSLLAITIGFPLANVCGQSQQTLKKPNIIFMLVDDMGWNGISSFGNPHVSTPHIDRLADEGMKFTEAYAAPVCTPTRGEFLSGEYGARTGMTQVLTHRVYPNAPLRSPRGVAKLPQETYTIANMLQEAGYATAISGKWHVGDGYRAANVKRQHGEQYFATYGFDYVGDAVEEAWNKVDKDKATLDIVRDVLQFIKDNRDKPFFAYASFFSIHSPLQAPDSLVEKYIHRGYPASTHPFGNASERPTAEHLAMIDYLDLAIGILLDGLEDLDVANETVIVFMSDNGAPAFLWDNYPLRGAKGTLYEGGIRVPMIVRWPGKVRPGTSSNTPVHIVDMFPTFMDIANGGKPTTKKLDGQPLTPILTGDNPIGQRALYWHHPHYLHDHGKTPSSAIRRGNYKLIYYYGDYLETHGHLAVRNEPYGTLKLGKRIQLFDLETDPYEQNDLFQSHTEIADALHRDLMRWLRQTGAAMPTENGEADIPTWFNTTIVDDTP